MQVPNSIIDPATAVAEHRFVVALKDDDWDHWNDVSQAPTYIGHRVENQRWQLMSHSGDPIDWTYDDTEVVVLEPAS